MKGLLRAILILLAGFTGGFLSAWVVLGSRAEATEGSIAFARNLEMVSDGVVTLEILERSGCEAVRQHHLERLESGILSADRLVEALPRVAIDDVPSASDVFDRAERWSTEHGLDDLGDRAMRLADDMMKR